MSSNTYLSTSETFLHCAASLAHTAACLRLGFPGSSTTKFTLVALTTSFRPVRTLTRHSHRSDQEKIVVNVSNSTLVLKKSHVHVIKLGCRKSSRLEIGRQWSPSVVVALRGSRRVPLRHSSRNGSASTSRGTASAVAHRTSPPTWSAHLVVAIDTCCGPLSCELFLPCMPLDDSPLCMDITSTSQCRLLAAKAATPPIMMHGTLAAVQAIVTFTTSG